MEVNTIYGPPGTGKTTELLALLEKELETYAPEEIAYVSFTREGSEQGKRRAMEKFSFREDRFPHFRTLHSTAFQALKLKRSSVIEKTDYKKFSDKMGMRFTGYYTEELRHDDDMYLFFDELHRNNPKTAQVYLSVLDMQKLQHVRKNYGLFKRTFGLMDFTDMIEEFIANGKEVPVKVAFIDEAQDLTTLQWRMVWTAFKHCEKIYIAGDDDQAIYQWSGADVDYFLSIEGKARILAHSYRLPDSVLRFAKRISSQMSKRIEKNYEGRGVEGGVYFHNTLDTIPLQEGETHMFLTRNHAFMPGIETILQKKSKVFTLNGEPSVTKEELAAIKLYEKVRATSMMSQEEEVKLRRFLKPKFDLRNPWFDSFKWSDSKLLYMRDVIKNKPNIEDRTIRVSTIHSSKGAEADNVILLLDITRNVASNLRNNPDAEHRAFYVGSTRAKNALHIVYAQTKNAYPIY